MKDLIHLDLFSGCGAFNKGFRDAGYTFKKQYFSEIDKHAIANYRYNFSNAEYVGSVTNVRDIERPSIITFGSPCQDFSLAGKRKGLEGGRSSLITYAIGLIERFRPDVFIWENVKGAFSSNAGADFWAIIQAFTNIGGYRFEWQLVNTAWFLPQNRERIYLIGHLADGCGEQVFSIGENDSRSNEGAAKTTNIRTLTAGGNIGGLHSSMTLVRPILTPDRLEKRQNGRRIKDVGEPAHTLTAQDRHGAVIQSNIKQGEEQCAIVSHYGHKNKEPIFSKRCPTLKAESHWHTPMVIQKTLDTAVNQGVITPDMQIRRLTEIECERLQGLPDNWTKWGMYDVKGQLIEKEVSSTQRYKMLGNAVTATVVQQIAERLYIK